jgi:hypothetical protein
MEATTAVSTAVKQFQGVMATDTRLRQSVENTKAHLAKVDRDLRIAIENGEPAEKIAAFVNAKMADEATIRVYEQEMIPANNQEIARAKRIVDQEEAQAKAAALGAKLAGIVAEAAKDRDALNAELESLVCGRISRILDRVAEMRRGEFAMMGGAKEADEILDSIVGRTGFAKVIEKLITRRGLHEEREPYKVRPGFQVIICGLEKL